MAHSLHPGSSNRPRIFYGWPLLGAGFLLYGLGTPTVSHSWTFFAPEITAQLGLSRGGSGAVYGTFVLVSSLAGPIAGAAIRRYGLRRVMTLGYAGGAIGLLCTGLSNGLLWLLLSFGLVLGASRAFSTILPTQTLASIWFVKYRSRALAFMLIAGGIFGKLMYTWNAWLLTSGFTWRHGWLALAALFVLLTLFTWTTVRDSPESIGQLPDGAASREDLHNERGTDAASKSDTDSETREVDFTPRAAVSTPQFWLLIFCGFGYSLPWFAISAHGRLHLEDLGFGLETAAGVLGWMALISVAGRLAGAAGDWIPSERLLGCALLLESVGMLLFLRSRTEQMALVALLLLGLGFGAGYICAAATTAKFFGRAAFAPTVGLRLALASPITFAAPSLAGWAYDWTGSYGVPFTTFAAISLCGGLIALVIRAPRPPEQTSETARASAS